MITQRTEQSGLLASDKAILDTYSDCEKNVSEQLRRIRRVDYQNRHANNDLEQEAWVGFLEAYHSYDPERGQGLDRRVSFVVWFKLLKLVNKEDRKHGRTFSNAGQENNANGDGDTAALDNIAGRECGAGDSTFAELLDELTSDGRTLVNLVLDTPGELVELIRESSSRATLRCVKEYVQEIGWTINRFRKAVTNVRESLWVVAD